MLPAQSLGIVGRNPAIEAPRRQRRKFCPAPARGDGDQPPETASDRAAVASGS